MALSNLQRVVLGGIAVGIVVGVVVGAVGAWLGLPAGVRGALTGGLVVVALRYMLKSQGPFARQKSD